MNARESSRPLQSARVELHYVSAFLRIPRDLTYSEHFTYSSSLIPHKKRGKFASVESAIEFNTTLN